MNKKTPQQELVEIDDTIQYLEDRRNNLIARMMELSVDFHAPSNLISFPNRSRITATAVLSDDWPSDPK